MRNHLQQTLLPVTVGIALIGIWYAYVTFANVASYVMPPPQAVAVSFYEAFRSGYIYPHLLFTAKSAALGYLTGCISGIVLGSVLALSPTIERAVYPWVVLFQSIPKVAIAPLLIVWFGFGLESKVVMVALISFFPVFINTFIGIRQADEDLVDVLRVSSASKASIFFHVKLPAAAGAIFAGLQIAVSFSLIGAIVAEFIASKEGLGTVIQQAALTMDTSLIFAGVLILALMGMIGNGLVRLAHKRVVFWEARSESLTDSTAM
jgi:NitT/TauT family transport system permease protein